LIVVSTEDFLWYVDQALDGMVTIVGGLGDETASSRPDLDGANSPYAILTHCLGVMEFWGGYAVAGRTIDRDREAEFLAEGHVADLMRRTAEARRQVEGDIADLEALAPPRGSPEPGDEKDLPIWRTQGGVLLHILEELYQHLGQMELSRDTLLAANSTGEASDP
jgi:hypothetical protein